MTDIHRQIYPVLLAGGTGSRLWPVSRELYPKQLVKFIGKDSLVQSTIKRLPLSFNNQNIRIVCGREHFHEIARHMEALGIAAEGKIISEPCGRNTAPALLLSILHVIEQDEEGIICVFPADHVIRDLEKFNVMVESAVLLADKGYIVTFGIQPNYPETGYGYIEGGAVVSHGAKLIKRFVEKPDLPTAKNYISLGNFYWNSGMFAFRSDVMIQEFQKYQPLLYDQLQRLYAAGDIQKADYEKLPSVSLDYAIMERTEKGVVLPSNFGWSDIGSWKSLYDFIPKDEKKNVIDGDVLAKDTENCFIMGHERLIATNRIKDLVIIETSDSVFVSDLESSRDVKEIVTTLKERNRDEYQQHRTVHYSWGSRTLLERNDDCIVFRNLLYPFSELPVHSKKTNSTSVTLIKGNVSVTGKQSEAALQEQETIKVEKGEDIKLVNNGNDPATIIQVQFIG